jgi:hypothetical protein
MLGERFMFESSSSLPSIPHLCCFTMLQTYSYTHIEKTHLKGKKSTQFTPEKEESQLRGFNMVSLKYQIFIFDIKELTLANGRDALDNENTTSSALN